MCSGSPPPAPDYTGAAEATAAGNLEAARAQTAANRPYETTPLGTREWTNLGYEDVDQPGFESAQQKYEADLAAYQGWQPRPEPGAMGAPRPTMPLAPSIEDYTSMVDQDKWRSEIKLSPELQNLFDISTQTQTGLGELGQYSVGQAREALSDPFRIEGEAPTFQGPEGELGAYGANRQRVMDAMMGRVSSDIGRDREAMSAQLVAQGIPRGSEAHNTEMERLDRQMTDARQQAEIAATSQANKEYLADIMGRTQMGKEGMDVFTTGGQARQQAISEAMLKRSLPLSELSSIMSGSQPAMPNFQPYGQQGGTAGPDYLSALQGQSGYDLAGYNAGVAGQNQLTSGLFGLGAAYLMSDIRLKHNITHIGQLPSGIPVYTYSYLGEDEVRTGVMAQEVLNIIPEAVIEVDGYYAVDYARIH